MFADGLTDMRNDVLNANVIQLICLARIIVEDREGQQRGICG